MKNYKKFLLCFILIFISIFSFACSGVELTTTLKSSGEIITTLDINLEEVEISKRHIIYNILNEYYSQLQEKYEENLLYYFSLVYENETYNNLTKQEKLTYISQKNINYVAWSDENDFYVDSSREYISITKNFASIYAFLMYFCPSAFEYDNESNKIKVSSNYKSLIDLPVVSKDGELEEEDNIFITSYIQNTNPFYYNNEEPVFFKNGTSLAVFAYNIKSGDKLVDVIETKAGLSSEEMEYVFNFSTPYKRLHGSGSVERTLNGYTHTWKFDSIDGEATFYRKYANYYSWYIFVIIISLIGIIVSFLFLKAKKNKKRKDGFELLKKIDEFESKKG